MRRLILLLLLSATLMSCGEARDVRIFTGPDVEAVRARYTALAAALNKKDPASVASFYDITTLIAEPEVFEGQLGIGLNGNNDALLADALSDVAFGHAAIEVSGDLAISQADCRFTRTDPQTHQAKLWLGYCMHSWHRGANGVWIVSWESRNVLPFGGTQ